MTPFLSDAEVADMCSPLLQPGAQKRHLRRLGLPFALKPNGRPLVSRERVHGLLDGRPSRGAGSASAGPDVEALKAMFNKRKKA